MPAAFAARAPFGESSNATASSAGDAELVERLEVERRARLRALGVVVGGDDRVPADRRARAARDACRSTGATRSRRSRASARARSANVEVVGDARAQLLRLEQRQLVRVPPLVQLVAVERLADELLEVPPDVPAVDRADHQRPLVGRQFVPELAVQPLPAGARRGLGIEDQPVEIEEKRADGHRGDGIDTHMAGETRRAVAAQPDWLRRVPTDKRLPEGAVVVHTGCGTSFHAAQTGGWAVQALEAVLRPPRADIMVCVSHEGGTELTIEAERMFGGDVWLVTGNPDSEFAELVDEVIVCTPEIERSWCHTASYTCAVAAIAALHGEDISELPAAVEQALQQTVEPSNTIKEAGGDLNVTRLR